MNSTDIVVFNLDDNNNNDTTNFFVRLTVGYLGKTVVICFTESGFLKFLLGVEIAASISLTMLRTLISRRKKRREKRKKLLDDCATMGRGGDWDFFEILEDLILREYELEDLVKQCLEPHKHVGKVVEIINKRLRNVILGPLIKGNRREFFSSLGLLWINVIIQTSGSNVHLINVQKYGFIMELELANTVANRIKFGIITLAATAIASPLLAIAVGWNGLLYVPVSLGTAVAVYQLRFAPLDCSRLLDVLETNGNDHIMPYLRPSDKLTRDEELVSNFLPSKKITEHNSNSLTRVIITTQKEGTSILVEQKPIEIKECAYNRVPVNKKKGFFFYLNPRNLFKNKKEQSELGTKLIKECTTKTESEYEQLPHDEIKDQFSDLPFENHKHKQLLKLTQTYSDRQAELENKKIDADFRKFISDSKSSQKPQTTDSPDSVGKTTDSPDSVGKTTDSLDSVGKTTDSLDSVGKTTDSLDPVGKTTDSKKQNATESESFELVRSLKLKTSKLSKSFEVKDSKLVNSVKLKVKKVKDLKLKELKEERKLEELKETDSLDDQKMKFAEYISGKQSKQSKSSQKPQTCPVVKNINGNNGNL
jgi:hypothetical protein